MKKYLMRGLAAVMFSSLFVGCSNEIEGVDTLEFNILKTYEDAFVARFGQPAATQDWGFSDAGARTMTRANQGEDYPATSTGINANANEWADPTEGKTFGGWVVPDPLTAEQKAVVKAYFQANPNLTYQDPEWRHFFVQQVYTGGTDAPETGNKEHNVAAGGSVYTSANMNLLTVGYNEQHINNFNAGGYSGSNLNTYEDAVNDDGTVNVLDKGYTANDFAEHHHADQIMLMVNIDDTRCMGYHNTGSSVQVNDKAALVDWQVIRTWANANGLNGDCLDDGWNRSFVGFDFALLSQEQASLKDENGNVINFNMNYDNQLYNLEYVWDGTDVLKKGTAPAESGVSGQTNIDLNLFPRSWHSYCKVENNKLVLTLNGWQAMQAEFSGEDWSGYEKLVIDFETAPDNNIELNIGANKPITKIIPAGTTHFEWELPEGEPINVTSLQMHAYEGKNITGTITQVYLVGDAPVIKYYESDYLMVNDNPVPYVSTNSNMYAGTEYTFEDADFKITVDGKECFNMAKVAELVNDGYLPEQNTNMRKWVKIEYGDGYFSDWIVTLTKANRLTVDPDPVDPDPVDPDPVTPGNPTDAICRIVVEDLTVGEYSDFDFNDVVFDVCPNDDGSTTTLVIRAIGGELPLYVGQKAAANEVHTICGVDQSTFVNTGWQTSSGIDYNKVCGTITISGYYDTRAKAKNIPIIVSKNGADITLSADVGKVASKICVGTDFDWCAERQDIDKKFHDAQGTKLFQQYVIGNFTNDDWYKAAVK